MSEHTADRDRLILYTIEVYEGGFVDDPDDPGKATKYGISAKSYPDLDIANLTVDDAIKLYKRDYFTKSGAHLIPSRRIAWKLFDTSVHNGPRRAARLLQGVSVFSVGWVVTHPHVRRAGLKGAHTVRVEVEFK